MFKPIEGKRLSQTIAIMTADGSIGRARHRPRCAARDGGATGAQVMYAAAPQRDPARRRRRSAAETDFPAQVAVEERMGCGYGLCFTCAVPVARKDGSRLRPPARVCRRAGVQPGARPVGSVAGRAPQMLVPTPPEGSRSCGRGRMSGRDDGGEEPVLAVDLNGLVLPDAGPRGLGMLRIGPRARSARRSAPASEASSRAASPAHPGRARPTPRAPRRPPASCRRSDCRTPGVEAFVAEELPRLARTGSPVIVSVAGGTLEEYVRARERSQGAAGVDGARDLPLRPRRGAAAASPAAARPERAARSSGAVARRVGARCSRSCRRCWSRARRDGACVRARRRARTHADRRRAGAGGGRGRLPAALGRRAAGCRARRSARSRCGRCTRSRAPCPTCRSWASVAVCDRRGRRRDAAGRRVGGAGGDGDAGGPCGGGRRRPGRAGYLKAKGLASPADIRGRLRAPAAGEVEAGTGRRAP